MTTKNRLKYWIEKKYRSRPGYPMATVACYGPNDRFATKLVIAILQSEKDKEAAILKRWFSEAIDVRLDLNIIQQAMDFLDEHPVKNVAIMERIIGCPHEERDRFPSRRKVSSVPVLG